MTLARTLAFHGDAALRRRFGRYAGFKLMQRPYGQLQGTAREPRFNVPAVQKNDAVTSTLGGLGWPQPMLYAALGGYASNTGVPVTPFTALQAAAVYACVRLISQDIAVLPLFLKRRLPNGKYVRADDHPLTELLNNPNRWQTAFEFWCYFVTSLCLRGNAYCVVDRDLDGRPVELIPVAPDRVSIMLTETGMMWYRVNSRRVGYGILVPPDDMIHLKNISLDGYMGVSPIAIAQDVIGLALATQQHGGILFRQGAMMRGVATHPGVLSKEASGRIADQIREVHAGVQNAHKVMVLEEGMKYEPITMTQEDAQFLQTRAFQVVDICRIYGVPPHKVGEYGRATFANVEQQAQQYIDAALKPTAQSIEQLCDRHLLFADERRSLGVKFDFEGVGKADTKSRYEAYQIALLNGWMNRNEVRAKENMNPVPGGDEYRVPLNTGPAAGIDHPENQAQRIPPAGAGADDGEDDGEDDGDEPDDT